MIPTLRRGPSRIFMGYLCLGSGVSLAIDRKLLCAPLVPNSLRVCMTGAFVQNLCFVPSWILCVLNIGPMFTPMFFGTVMYCCLVHTPWKQPPATIPESCCEPRRTCTASFFLAWLVDVAVITALTTCPSWWPKKRPLNMLLVRSWAGGSKWFAVYKSGFRVFAQHLWCWAFVWAHAWSVWFWPQFIPYHNEWSWSVCKQLQTCFLYRLLQTAH